MKEEIYQLINLKIKFILIEKEKIMTLQHHMKKDPGKKRHINYKVNCEKNLKNEFLNIF